MGHPGRPTPLLTSEQAGEHNTTQREALPCLRQFFKSPAPDFSKTHFIPPPKAPFSRASETPADTLPETCCSVTSPGRKHTLSCPVPTSPPRLLGLTVTWPFVSRHPCGEPCASPSLSSPLCTMGTAICGLSRAITHEDPLAHTNGSVKKKIEKLHSTFIPLRKRTR